MKRYVWYASVFGPLGLARRIIRYVGVLGPLALAKRIISSKRLGELALKGKPYTVNRDREALNLQPEEWVEVRSPKEIFATLDGQGKHKGLTFTREMAKFCGRRFKVYKRLNKIILEATGEMRTIKAPTVLLEGVICDGEFHGGCTRSCFCFWREAWLKRAPYRN